ncbi:hypothetical protein PPERSA_03640 [Pseudocohnilembus persalinus]|uniref:Uncharacterized protein n=1 Tax=Pseudocohnilembus persalinus TaxID=266149 RepID=A0A0V0QDY0_PSEPJ|nr:hypothetical protein PPERSA_03640 [Pseudocohnilembus persalinus]|eukprot:KRX00419.1 hypothetical protein PPERSA_03640 [Pseudocohnilembus persalinus]
MGFIQNDPELFFSKKNKEINKLSFLKRYFNFFDSKDVTQVEEIFRNACKQLEISQNFKIVTEEKDDLLIRQGKKGNLLQQSQKLQSNQRNRSQSIRRNTILVPEVAGNKYQSRSTLKISTNFLKSPYLLQNVGEDKTGENKKINNLINYKNIFIEMELKSNDENKKIFKSKNKVIEKINAFYQLHNYDIEQLFEYFVRSYQYMNKNCDQLRRQALNLEYEKRKLIEYLSVDDQQEVGQSQNEKNQPRLYFFNEIAEENIETDQNNKKQDQQNEKIDQINKNLDQQSQNSDKNKYNQNYQKQEDKKTLNYLLSVVEEISNNNNKLTIKEVQKGKERAQLVLEKYVIFGVKILGRFVSLLSFVTGKMTESEQKGIFQGKLQKCVEFFRESQREWRELKASDREIVSKQVQMIDEKCINKSSLGNKENIIQIFMKNSDIYENFKEIFLKIFPNFQDSAQLFLHNIKKDYILNTYGSREQILNFMFHLRNKYDIARNQYIKNNKTQIQKDNETLEKIQDENFLQFLIFDNLIPELYEQPQAHLHKIIGLVQTNIFEIFQNLQTNIMYLREVLKYQNDNDYQKLLNDQLNYDKNGYFVQITQKIAEGIKNQKHENKDLSSACYNLNMVHQQQIQPRERGFSIRRAGRFRKIEEKFEKLIQRKF